MGEGADPNLPIPGLATQPAEQASPDKYKVVSIRLRAAEFEGFCDQANALGLTNSLALRIAARRIGGFLEIDQSTRLQLERILATLGEISQNIRHLHADYLAGGKIDLDGLAAQRTAFGQEFAQLDALLRCILNVSQRRSDGRQKITEAMT
jgi:type IV secretion system T-DNA border endonuclease VirD1